MADRTLTVGNGKTYASLNAAITAQRSYLDLTTDNGSGGPGKVYIDCYNLAASAADTTAADAGAGWTTDADNYLIIRGAPSERNLGIYSTTRYHLEVSNATGLKLHVPYSRVIDLQVQVTAASQASGWTGISMWNAGAGVRIERCIVKGVISGTNTGQHAGIYPPEGATGNTSVINCLVYDFVNGTETHRGFNMDCTNGAVINVLNCTAVDCRSGFDNYGTGSAITKNCGASGCNTGFVGCTQTTCSSTTPTFANAGADDFHLATTDVTWKRKGTNISGVLVDDIDGQRRVFWDIGCDEFMEAPGGILASVDL